MNRRVLAAIVGFGIAFPSVVLQLAWILRSQPPALSAWPQLCIANLALLLAAGAFCADYPLTGRAGKAALTGLLAAVLIPGPTALDAVVMHADPGWDVGTWLAVAMPYLLLLAMLACAEAGLYLLATRPRVAPDR